MNNNIDLIGRALKGDQKGGFSEKEVGKTLRCLNREDRMSDSISESLVADVEEVERQDV